VKKVSAKTKKVPNGQSAEESFSDPVSRSGATPHCGPEQKPSLETVSTFFGELATFPSEAYMTPSGAGETPGLSKY
jgi:phage terminase large subunit GpA-like protein